MSKIKVFLNVMFEPRIDLYIVAIYRPRDRDCRGNDFVLNTFGVNSIIFASSPFALSHVSDAKKRSTPLYLINVDI